MGLVRKSLLVFFAALCVSACGSTQLNTVPYSVVATPGAGQVNVSWLPVSGATSYNVYYNTVQTFGSASTGTVMVSGILSTSTTVPNLTNGVTYYFVVTSVTPTGESMFSTQVAAIPSPVPTNITVNAAGTGQVTVGWTAVSGATYYSIYYGTTNPVDLTTAKSITGITTTSYMVFGLTSGVAYYFVVVASSPPSAQGTIVVP